MSSKSKENSSQNQEADSPEQTVTKRMTCFIITPVGEANSEIRRKAEGLINSVINPVLKGELDYEVFIPHQMADPGSITSQVIGKILDCDLVVANLTGLNPNVMYELAIRHAKKRPVVCLVEKGTSLPFDITTERTVFYDNDMYGVDLARAEFKSYVIAAMSDSDISNPIYRVVRESVMQEVIADKADKYMLDRLDELQSTLSNFITKGNTSQDYYNVEKRSGVNSNSTEFIIEVSPALFSTNEFYDSNKTITRHVSMLIADALGKHLLSFDGLGKMNQAVSVGAVKDSIFFKATVITNLSKNAATAMLKTFFNNYKGITFASML